MANCPRCGTKLNSQQVGPVLVDGCPSCGGLWFDTGELARLAKCGPQALVEADHVFDPPARTEVSEQGPMNCPKCNEALYGFSFKHSPEVSLDACPKCKGVWVDHHELENIAERLAPGVSKRPNQEPSMRSKVRQAAGFLQRVHCPKCGEDNYPRSAACWACGVKLMERRGAMLCPRCDTPLRRKPVSTEKMGIDLIPEADHCERCGGTWVGPDRIPELSDRPIDWLLRCEVFLTESLVGDAADEPEQRVCPACHIALEERARASQADALVDHCANCGGLWLRRGELSATKEGVEPPSRDRGITTSLY